ncbi:MAG: AAA family ATPase [Candidatus Omnitrophica bacterium]|nr:AAA family ATPase [Candidatus Omnitrophota bacterium]
MYFKKLELYGFKSFVDKTTLIFEPGVTAIVGPNGTGKSNISDAIKWVLGEQSAKSMRGSKMEDVIFNGTEARPPVNMAEVSLILSNEEKRLAIDYDEVTITRRLYRSGESEYLLNKTLVRLKDIQELLMGTGIGTESYSLLEQGRIDAILSSKPEERRVVFEEASGITRFKKKKAEALRRLEATEENLLRVNDIITEVNRQLGSIQRQVNKARRYQEHYEQLKILDTQYTYREYNVVKTEKEKFEECENAFRNELNSLESELAGLAQAFDEIKSALSKVEGDYSQLNAKVLNASTQIEKNTDRIHLNNERIEEFGQRAENLTADIDNSNAKIKELEEQFAQLKIRLNSFLEEKNNKVHNLNLKQASICEIEKLIKQIHESIESTRLTAVKLLSEHAQIKNELAKLSANIHNAHSRLLRLHQEKEKTENELSAINAKIEEKMSLLDELKGRIDTEELQVSQLRSDYDALNQEIRNLESEYQKSKQSLIAGQSQLEVLEKLIKTYEGFSSNVKNFMLKKETHPHLFEGVYDVLVNLIDVTPGFEMCVENALGEYLQAVVVDNKQTAYKLTNFLKEEQIGRIRFIALDSIPLGQETIMPQIAERRITDVIKPQFGYEKLINYLLRDTFIIGEKNQNTEKTIPAQENTGCESLTQSLSQVKEGRMFSYTIANAESVEVIGDFNNWVSSLKSRMERAQAGNWQKFIALNPGVYRYKFIVDGRWVLDPANPRSQIDDTGNVNSVIEVLEYPVQAKPQSMISDSQGDADFSGRLISQDGQIDTLTEVISSPVKEHGAGLILQKTQMKMLQEECVCLKEAIKYYEAKEQEKRQQLVGMERELTQLNDILHKEKIVFANKDSERSNIEAAKKKLDDEIAILNLEIDETTLDEQELMAKEIEKKKRLEEIDELTRVNEKKMAQGQELIAIKTQEREELLVVIAEMKTEFSLLNEQEAALNTNFSMLDQSIESQRANAKEYLRQKEDLLKRSEELSIQKEELKQKTTVLETEKQQMEEALQGISLQRGKLLAEFEDVQNQVKIKENRINAIKNNMRDVDIKKVELNFKIESLVNSLKQAYKIDLLTLTLEPSEGVDWNSQKLQIEELKIKVERLGAVNLAAVEEEEELKERAEFLNSQKDDLISAKQSLMQAIQKINRTTKELFLETFEKSKATFKEYFKLLFGGGDAQLHLIEDKDILESGIDIIVRPPGKRLQSITLLSGGEKTLTAIALLFAIYKIKPTPFCVLDEMDAPLDESNIDRFTRVLQEFLKDSQFIIITHNKKTIGMADVMYGVTMEEAGISKIVSVKFSDYKENSQDNSQGLGYEQTPQKGFAETEVTMPEKVLAH